MVKVDVQMHPDEEFTRLAETRLARNSLTNGDNTNDNGHDSSSNSNTNNDNDKRNTV